MLGYFGYRTDQLDGQTVKTRDMLRLLREQKGERYVSYFDTEDLRYGQSRAIMRMLRMLWSCNVLVYLPAHNNLRKFFPALFLLSLIRCFSIHYFVVGGWLREFLSRLPVHRSMLAHVAGIHVETRRLKEELEKYYNYKNVDLFPNFRFFDFSPSNVEHEKLRLVFMARVNRMKGLDWIFSLADYIKKKSLDDKISITFYGPLNNEDCDYFLGNVKRFSFVEYCGELKPQDIHKTLSDYDVMLLPTHYYTEGLQGSVVDAYISGIPVIVTEWKHAHEFVDDGITGYIIPFCDGCSHLIDKVMNLEADRSLLRLLKDNALCKRQDFTPPVLRM